MFFAFFCRKDSDQEIREYIDENNADLDDNEEYLHLKTVCCTFSEEKKRTSIVLIECEF